jgi:hypothetical protein
MFNAPYHMDNTSWWNHVAYWHNAPSFIKKQKPYPVLGSNTICYSGYPSSAGMDSVVCAQFDAMSLMCKQARHAQKRLCDDESL